MSPSIQKQVFLLISNTYVLISQHKLHGSGKCVKLAQNIIEILSESGSCLTYEEIAQS